MAEMVGFEPTIIGSKPIAVSSWPHLCIKREARKPPDESDNLGYQIDVPEGLVLGAYVGQSLSAERMNSRLVTDIQSVVAVDLSLRNLEDCMVLDVLVALLSNGAVNQNACILREVVCDVGNLAALGDLVVVSNVDLGTLLQVISCEGDGLLCSINSEGLALNRGVSNNSVLSTLLAIAFNQPDALNLIDRNAYRNLVQHRSAVGVQLNALEVRNKNLVILRCLFNVGTSLSSQQTSYEECVVPSNRCSLVTVERSEQHAHLTGNIAGINGVLQRTILNLVAQCVQLTGGDVVDRRQIEGLQQEILHIHSVSLPFFSLS